MSSWFFKLESYIADAFLLHFLCFKSWIFFLLLFWFFHSRLALPRSKDASQPASQHLSISVKWKEEFRFFSCVDVKRLEASRRQIPFFFLLSTASKRFIDFNKIRERSWKGEWKKIKLRDLNTRVGNELVMRWRLNWWGSSIEFDSFEVRFEESRLLLRKNSSCATRSLSD